MKNYFLFILFILVNNLFSQTVLIKDIDSKLPIKKAELSCEEIGVFSEEDGVAKISLFNMDDTITIFHISYYPKKMLKKNISNTIYLKQKAHTLSDVFLKEELKIPDKDKYPIFTIKPTGINRLQTSITGLLTSQTSIVVQESQGGGGSPNYRGMEANRLLLVIDGIQLNNAIYRSGHVQSSNTISPFFTESISLISGPASVAYGNGAMGGAILIKTLQPKTKTRITLHQQFESSSNTVKTSFHANYHKKNFLHTTAFSLKSAGNLKMGERRLHGYELWGKEYVATINNEQLFTNYGQVDIIHKTMYKSKNKEIGSNTQYSKSTKIYRFDKMNDINNGQRRYEKWYYGPQERFLQSINYSSKSKAKAFEKINIMMAYQDIKESRHIQKANDNALNNRFENVKILDLNVDANKKLLGLNLVYGIGGRHEDVFSTANLSVYDELLYNTTRYPGGGSKVQNVFAYSQVNIKIKKSLSVLFGGRWNNNKLVAKFNSTDINLEKVENNNSSFVTSALVSYSPVKHIKINASYYDGFRNPNIDDLGKVFSKDDISVVVPNADLMPEYAQNFEFSLNYIKKYTRLQLQFFNSKITNAIKREYSSFNGMDSMFYDGQIMRIQMNQNIEKAKITGISLNATFNLNSFLQVNYRCNYLKGVTSENQPLAHIPPLNANFSLSYKLPKQQFDAYAEYSAWKRALDYDDAGVDNLEEGTIDGNPEWYTINMAYTNKIDEKKSLTFSVKNIFDIHYKTFASGISASGRNYILSLYTVF